MRKIQEINFNNEIYPEKLRKIKNPPLKLYALGNVALLKKPSLAIVGTRHITEYGKKNCRNFAQKIVQNAIPIVSGMAIGTDTVAHKTALTFGGETIAVLAGGFEHIFPIENLPLFEQIIQQNGLVITEYPPNDKVKSERFLERNRIVSGLSEGVLVIEAAHRSGTSVTAKHAYSQGKIVMALPGRLDNSYGVGVNKLIQEGAKLVTDMEDILRLFPQFTHPLGKTIPPKQETIFELEVKQEYQEIVKILKNKTLSAEEIRQETKAKDLRQTLNLLVTMELEDLIEQEIGAGYYLKGEKK